jgi:hypothetical protein
MGVTLLWYVSLAFEVWGLDPFGFLLGGVKGFPLH